jgi:hypothetical protein
MELEFFNPIPLLKKLVKHFFRFFLGSVFKLAQPSFFFGQGDKMRVLAAWANRALRFCGGDFNGRLHWAEELHFSCGAFGDSNKLSISLGA